MTKITFITGTSTEVGKTIATGLLAKYYLDQGERVVTQKWIQTGASLDNDIATHHRLMGVNPNDYAQYDNAMCPQKFDFPAAPNLAARLENRKVDIERLKTSTTALAHHFDRVLVEGLGGFLMPYDSESSATLADVVQDMELPVIVVMDNVLGTINHTLLTIEAIHRRGLTVEGIIVNNTQSVRNGIIAEDNPKIIQTVTGVEILGEIPYSEIGAPELRFSTLSKLT